LKLYISRRAAFRAAKRDNKIPVSLNPEKVIYPNTAEGNEVQPEKLDFEKNIRLYKFRVLIFTVTFEISVREDKEAFYGETNQIGDQLPHFNSGETNKKLPKHHYFRKK
jgi:hypothetical protein